MLKQFKSDNLTFNALTSEFINIITTWRGANQFMTNKIGILLNCYEDLKVKSTVSCCNKKAYESKQSSLTKCVSLIYLEHPTQYAASIVCVSDTSFFVSQKNWFVHCPYYLNFTIKLVCPNPQMFTKCKLVCLSLKTSATKGRPISFGQSETKSSLFFLLWYGASRQH